MGLLDDWLRRLRGEASKRAATAAAAAAAASASRAVKAVGDDLLDFAEGELERARGARGVTEEPAEATPAAAPQLRPTAAEREARAREELQRLKAQLGSEAAQQGEPAGGGGEGEPES